MNPVTRALLKQLGSDSMEEFVAAWDELEVLVVEIYRGGAASREQAREYMALKGRLGRLYPQRQAAMRPHWQATRIKGQPVDEDPFAALMAIESANDFVDNWEAMQVLPAAREAVNGLLMEMIEGRGGGTKD